MFFQAPADAVSVLPAFAVPLIAGYAYHKQAYEGRDFKRFAEIYADVEEPVA